VEEMTGKEIKELRNKLKLTQKELAGKIKVDAITVSRWELGKQKPSPKALRTLNRLARR